MESGQSHRKDQDKLRMSGFLEKKGKMKLMSSWKKYWFVLEERLLLYYRSEMEYKNLSPCRGSLNMGLVTSVCPGSSQGPCIIQIVTRTQMVQLRAKNRATQEEWLHALLLSKSLPFVSKISKPPTFKSGFLGCTKSLESLSFDKMFRRIGLEKECTLPRHLNYNKNQISGNYYGGSLDTAIWSKKCRPFHIPSPNLPKGKMLEKILGFSKENDFHNLIECHKKNTFNNVTIENEIKFLGKHIEEEEEEEEKDCENIHIERKCKIHDENRNHHNQDRQPLHEMVGKKKIKIYKTCSEPQVNENGSLHDTDFVKLERKDGSPFDRIKNALGKTPKDKSLKMNGDIDMKVKPTRKRRQSFLQKVFKRKSDDIYEYDSDITDPLYETINIKTEPRPPVSPIFSNHDNVNIDEVHNTADNCRAIVKNSSNEILDNFLYTEPKKTLAGSKIILPVQAMSELKMNLKSRQNCENNDLKYLDSDEEVSDINNSFKSNIVNKDKNNDTTVPLLPPRRISRPVSPWHDVPTNNAPINAKPKSFFVHQAVVKFKDHTFEPAINTSKIVNNCELNKNDSQQDLLKPQIECSKNIKKINTSAPKRSDDLSLLLTQLTKITVAPLAEPEIVDDSCSSESEKCLGESQHSDPDYDIPRPHKPLNILINSENKENKIIPSMQFLGRRDENSDTSLSFQSIEPDSLEITEKKNHLNKALSNQSNKFIL